MTSIPCAVTWRDLESISRRFRESWTPVAQKQAVRGCEVTARDLALQDDHSRVIGIVVAPRPGIGPSCGGPTIYLRGFETVGSGTRTG